MHLQEGTILQNRYEILRFIGSGGFGCTYEARDKKFTNNRSVAIKEFFVKDFCSRDAVTSHVKIVTEGKVKLVEKLRRKFIDEANALNGLEHPNIVHVTDIFQENGTAYYVMEYIDGHSIADIINVAGLLSEDKALEYVSKVAAALKYIHAKNRLHLDVKPQNIMVDKNGRVVLIDFGVSKQYDEENGENTSTLVGSTPGYAPIEQNGNVLLEFNAASDIYALGATLYKMVTGKTPMAATLRAGDSNFRELAYSNNVSPNIRQAIDKAMQISRNDRPQSIDEFMKILNSTSSDEIIEVSPVQTELDGEKKKEDESNVKPSNETNDQSTLIGCGVAILVLIGLICFAGFKSCQEEKPKVDTPWIKDSQKPATELPATEMPATAATWEPA